MVISKLQQLLIKPTTKRVAGRSPATGFYIICGRFEKANCCKSSFSIAIASIFNAKTKTKNERQRFAPPLILTYRLLAELRELLPKLVLEGWRVRELLLPKVVREGWR